MIKRRNAMKVINRFKVLLAEKEAREERRISYREIQSSTGIATSTLSSWATNRVTKYERQTILAFCLFFVCKPGDLITLES